MTFLGSTFLAIVTSSYRPISILPCLSKVCESIVHNQLNDYSRCNQNIIQNKNQFAYTTHCSTATALLKVVDSGKFTADQGKYTVAIFLDLRKAFDVINHDILLDKLRSIGLGEVETNWFSSYLTSRQQHVVCNNAHSDLNTLVTGIPQASP